MAYSQRRDTGQKRRFRGQREAEGLLRSLDTLRGPALRRVREALGVAQRLAGLSARHNVIQLQGKAVSGTQAAELVELLNLTHRMNALLARYRVRPSAFCRPMGSRRLSFTLVPIDAKREAETDAIMQIVELADVGLIGKIRECARASCRKPFFARFAHQTHCPGGACRIAEFRETEKWKIYRQDKAKMYYWFAKWMLMSPAQQKRLGGNFKEWMKTKVRTQR